MKYTNTVVDRFSRHRFSRNPDLVENFAVTNHFYSIKIQYSRKFDLVDYFFVALHIFTIFLLLSILFTVHKHMNEKMLL